MTLFLNLIWAARVLKFAGASPRWTAVPPQGNQSNPLLPPRSRASFKALE